MNDAKDKPARAGHTAISPVQIPLSGWISIMSRVATRVVPDQFGLIAAGIAFYALLAAFPAIGALIALAGLFTDPGAVVFQLEAVAGLLPAQAANILLDQANEVAGASSEGLSLALVVGVGFATYLSTRATTSLIHGLNVAYEEFEERGFLHFWGVVIALTTALLFASVLIVLLMVGVPALLTVVPVDFETGQWIAWARWALLAVVFVLGLASLYRWGPSRRGAKWRWLTPGAAVAGVLWFAASWGFSIYVANFASYNESFGSLGGVIILLTWLWLTAFIVLFGALLDAEIEHQTARDSTRGPDRPMGKRGAYKADTLPDD